MKYLALLFALAYYATAGAADWKQNAPFAIPLADQTSATAIFIDAETLAIAKPGNPPILGLFALHAKDSPPGPTPGPMPDPTPPTPTPRGPLTLIWIEETGQRTPQQAAAITDAELRARLAAAGWKFRVADADVIDENGRTPPDLAPFIDAARARGLPSLYAIDATGAEIFAGKAPDNRDEFATILAKLGLTLSRRDEKEPENVDHGNGTPSTLPPAEKPPAENVDRGDHTPATLSPACTNGNCQQPRRWLKVTR